MQCEIMGLGDIEMMKKNSRAEKFFDGEVGCCRSHLESDRRTDVPAKKIRLGAGRRA